MTVGIIGTGKIGKTVIKHLSGFGCKILAYDIYESDEVRQYAQYTDLDTIYRECDIISLDKMKQGVILINCARGSLVDTQALIDGIESGKVGFAGLDVVEHESGLYYFNRMGEPLNNPQLAILRSYSNVVVTPHTAFYTQEAVSDMVENSIICARAYINGEKTPYEVV